MSTLQLTVMAHKLKKKCILQVAEEIMCEAGQTPEVGSFRRLQRNYRAVPLDKNYFDGRQIINDPICNDNGTRLKSFCRE